MRGVVFFVSLLELQLLISSSNALDLPFGRRRHAHRQNVRPALASNQFLKNSMRSSTADSKNDMKQQQQQPPQQQQQQHDHEQLNHHDEDIEVLFRHQEEIQLGKVAEPSNGWTGDEDIEVLFQPDDSEEFSATMEDDDDDEEEDETLPPLDAMERAWRHCKKPLLRVGSKGMQFTHGNSLRQLLEAHQVVKVKVNTKRFGSLENAFEALKGLAVESGAPADIELVQVRECEKTILFGMPGIMEKIGRDEFPPPPPPEYFRYPQP